MQNYFLFFKNNIYYDNIYMVVELKKKKFFKDKKTMIIQIILFFILLGCFVFVGTRNYSKKVLKDSVRFDKEFNVGKDNVFVYVTASDAYKHVQEDNAIIIFGLKNSKWVSSYVKIVNDVANKVGIDKIYYFDITADREDRNGSYQSIVKYLEDYITYLDDGRANLYAPTILVKKDGLIYYFNDDTALSKGMITAEEYWNEYHKNLAINELTDVFNYYVGEKDGE